MSILLVFHFDVLSFFSLQNWTFLLNILIHRKIIPVFTNRNHNEMSMQILFPSVLNADFLAQFQFHILYCQNWFYISLTSIQFFCCLVSSYAECELLDSNDMQFGRSSLAFQKTVLPPFSGSKSKPSKKQAAGRAVNPEYDPFCLLPALLLSVLFGPEDGGDCQLLPNCMVL